MARDLLTLVRTALADRYTVEREIGRGGAARVFLARTPEGTDVALKVLHPELLASTTADRFLREIRLTSRLNHPNIAKLLDSGERDWLVYYVMTYSAGPSLRAAIDSVRRLTIPDALRVAGDVLGALEHAHAQGIIHRDVKPENIIIAREGAVLLDFGIARAIDASVSDQLTRSGMSVGTSRYMSPEQVSSLDTIDHRCDIYAVGCVLFECLAGRPPFADRNESLVLQQQLTVPAPDVRTLRSDTPPPLAEAVARALRKTPSERWSSASEMLLAMGAPPG